MVTPKSEVSELNKMGFDIKHKKISDINNPDNQYDVYWGRNAKSNDYLTTKFSTKWAKSLGGSNPSHNDLWLHVTSYNNPNNQYLDKDGNIINGDRVIGTHLIIKTNKDDSIPENVIKQSAELVLKNSHLEKVENGEKKKWSMNNLVGVDVVFCKKDYVSKKEGSVSGQVQVDHKNANYIRFNSNNIEIIR